ncbi:MAG: hypothetical protein PHY59_03530 [Methanobacterium sp.]|nr:hypothetical protein [Methanobacterium sp.]
METAIIETPIQQIYNNKAAELKFNPSDIELLKLEDYNPKEMKEYDIIGYDFELFGLSHIKTWKILLKM